MAVPRGVFYFRRFFETVGSDSFRGKWTQMNFFEGLSINATTWQARPEVGTRRFTNFEHSLDLVVISFQKILSRL